MKKIIGNKNMILNNLITPFRYLKDIHILSRDIISYYTTLKFYI